MASSSEIRNWVIYKITNPKGRIYIGKTSNYTNRLRQYKCIQLKEQNLITRSLIKYGFENHTFDKIDEFSGSGNFCEGKEIFWIRSYMSNRSKYPNQNGMNMTDGGEGILGIKRSQKFREEARERKLGKPNSDHQKMVAKMMMTGNSYRLGCKQSQAEKDKRNLRLRGQKRTILQKETYKKAQILINGTSIIVFDSTNNTTSEYKSFGECSKAVGMHKETIRRILKGRILSLPLIKNRIYTFKYK